MKLAYFDPLLYGIHPGDHGPQHGRHLPAQHLHGQPGQDLRRPGLQHNVRQEPHPGIVEQLEDTVYLCDRILPGVYILASQKNSPPPSKIFSFFCGYFAVI